MATTAQIKVGDFVGFKYDIEQTGEVVEIGRDRWTRELVYTVRATEGGYVNNRTTGVLVTLGADEIW